LNSAAADAPWSSPAGDPHPLRGGARSSHRSADRRNRLALHGEGRAGPPQCFGL